MRRANRPTSRHASPVLLALAIAATGCAGSATPSGSGGKCAAVVCTARDRCHVAGACDPASGACTAQTAKACPLGQACDLADGACKAAAGNPCARVSCSASDLCHVAGSCDPATGLCAAQTARSCPANQRCDLADGSCKPVDLCAGVTCTATDLCHVAGVCNPATGLCSPQTARSCAPNQSCNAADGTCRSNDLCAGVKCAASDACHIAGVCIAATGLCSPQTPKTCPGNQTCNPSDGTCKSSDPCAGVTCTASDLCHVAGSCNPSTGQCTPQVPKSCPSNQTCSQSDGTCKPNDLCTGVSCSPLDQCHEAGTCDPASGRCSNPLKPAGAACNADNNACTQNDQCTASGVCVAGTPLACTTPPNSICYQAAGICRTDPNTAACQYTPKTGTACPDAACTSGSTCRADGSCAGSFDCTVSSSCCTGGKTCNAASKQCETLAGALVPVPAEAKQLPFYSLSQVAVDALGRAFLAGSIVAQAEFDGNTVSPAGGNDLLLASFDAQSPHAARWAKSFGDRSEQLAVGVGVTADGTVAVIGNFAGNLTIGSSTLSNAGNSIDFLGAVGAADGAGKWALSLDDGGKSLLAIAANPKLDLIAVCGAADKAAPWIPGAAFGGGTSDAVVGLFSSSGVKLWAVQLGGSAQEECDAIAVDDNGDVLAAGQFNGATLSIPGAAALTGPGVSTRFSAWVAKLAGSTGRATAAAAFGGTAGRAKPLALATDGAGKILVGGTFTGNLSFASNTLTSSGLGDAWLARLDGASLAPLWAVRQGAASANDFVTAVAATSAGDPIAVGQTGSSIFLWSLGAADGATRAYTIYGPNLPVAPSLSVNRSGTANLDEVVIGASFYSSLSFGAASALKLATSGVSDQQSFLLWAPLQPSGP